MKGRPPVASARFKQVSRLSPGEARLLVAKMLTKIMLQSVYSKARSEFDYENVPIVLFQEPRSSEST